MAEEQHTDDADSLAGLDSSTGDSSAGGAEQGIEDMDLDALLREFDESPAGTRLASADPIEPEEQPEEQATDSETGTNGSGGDERVDELYRWASEEQRRRQAEDDRRELDAAIERARGELGELGENVHKDELEAYLLREYSMNDRFAAAFESRHEDREHWNNQLGRAIGDYRRHVERRADPDLTADKNAVTSAIKAASRAPTVPEGGPSQRDIEQMSDAEFERYKRQLLSK